MDSSSENSTSNTPVAVFGMRGLNQRVGGNLVFGDISFSSPLSTEFPPEMIPTAQRDFEIIASKLKDYPSECESIVRAVAAGNMLEGIEILRNIGLTETDLKSAGGGAAWVAVAVGVAVLLYASDAW